MLVDLLLLNLHVLRDALNGWGSQRVAPNPKARSPRLRSASLGCHFHRAPFALACFLSARLRLCFGVSERPRRPPPLSATAGLPPVRLCLPCLSDQSVFTCCAVFSSPLAALHQLQPFRLAPVPLEVSQLHRLQALHQDVQRPERVVLGHCVDHRRQRCESFVVSHSYLVRRVSREIYELKVASGDCWKFSPHLLGHHSPWAWARSSEHLLQRQRCQPRRVSPGPRLCSHLSATQP